MPARILPVLILVLLLTLAGCGEPTYKVSGTVAFDGKLVENGSIVFESADGGPGLASSGIRNCKYELHSPPGKKKVLISAFRVRPGTENDPQPASDAYIPAKYNNETELFKDVLPADNRFEFDLTK